MSDYSDITNSFDFTWNRETSTVTIQFTPTWWEPRPAVIRQTHPHMKERLRPQDLDIQWMRDQLVSIFETGDVRE